MYILSLLKVMDIRWIMKNDLWKNENDDFSFDDRDNLYRVFKNDEDKKKETINLKEGKCITLESLYNEFIKPPL